MRGEGWGVTFEARFDRQEVKTMRVVEGRGLVLGLGLG